MIEVWYHNGMIELSASKVAVEDTLRTFLDTKKKTATTIHPSYGRLLAEIERVVFSGGKRLRPHLVFLGYGSYDEPIRKVAAAHELLHTALLAHDDIIDRDTIRHGQPTIHAAYNDFYAQEITDTHERQHFSQSSALLAGDLLISFAYECIASAGLPGTLGATVTSLLAEGMFEVVGGELLDTEAAFSRDPADPLTIYRYKTASYSLIAPLLSGAVTSPRQYDQASLDALKSFAVHAGIAYQIKDDLLGVFGHSDQTGKSTIGDLREGKRTYLIDAFTASASPEQMAVFSHTFGNGAADDNQFSALKDALQSSGACAATEAAIADHTQQALDSLKEVYNPDLTDSLTALADMLITRNT